jgi:hypothetical protein
VFLPWEKVVRVEVKDELTGWRVWVWMDEHAPLLYFFEGAAQRIAARRG